MSATVQAPCPVGAPAGAEAGVPSTRDVYERATRAIASLVVLAVGTDERLGYGATAALPLAIVLLPLWRPVLRQYAFATLLAGLTVLAAVSGVVLSEISSADHIISGPGRVQTIGLLGSGVAAFGLLLWAGSQLPLHRIALLYGAGGLADTVVNGELSWKYNLAVPTTFVVLGVVERRRSGILAAAVLVALGVAGIADEARSYFAACVLAATLTVWQRRPAPRGGAAAAPVRQRWFPAVVLAGLGVAVYFFITALATAGTLGETLEERSSAQISSSGSVLIGGRPEWAATRELFELEPAGYGAGVVPNWTDRMAGRAGLASINVDAGGYADNYMFGGPFELHSVAADLWVRFGWAGVVLAATIVVLIVRCLSSLLAARQAPAYVIVACILALWYMLFGPMYSNWLDVCVALGLVVVGAGPRSSAPDADRAVR